jgi:serine/threonine-protein kinase
MDDELRRRAEARIGTVLCGKYTIEAVLGVGGMAVVYAATHRNQKRVAVKLLHPELSLHGDVRARFMREGYAANTVDHPGAVAVLDDDTAEDGAAFLVMERLEGAEVEELCARHGGRFDPRVALAIAEPLLAVLEAAHAKGIVHRDIKPANLYLTRDGTLKVLDFGIARARDALSAGQRGTQTGMLMGTPAFMAPEQAMGKSSEIDGTTDVWAVGATIFALLSGEQVHDGETATALLVRAATQPARSLAQVVPGADARLVALVDRALAFDRAARWPSAGAMRVAVRDVYQAMFGAPLTKESLEHIMAAPLASAATVFAPSGVSSHASQPSHPSHPSQPSQPPQASQVALAPSLVAGASQVGASSALRSVAQGATPPPQLASFAGPVTGGGASAPPVMWGPPGSPGASPLSAAGMPVDAAPAPAKRPSLLLPALILGAAIILGFGLVGILLSRGSRGAPATAAIDSASPPAATADGSASPAVAPSAAPPPSASASASGALPAEPDAPPTPVVVPPPGPPRAAAVLVVRPNPAVVVVTPPAAAPVVVAPAAPAAPPPMCRAQCTETARSCKSKCGSSGGSFHDRHVCKQGCDTVERDCRARAGC